MGGGFQVQERWVWEEDFRFRKGGFNMLCDCTTGEADFRLRKGGFNMQYDCSTGVREEGFGFRKGGFNMQYDCTTGVWGRISGSRKVRLTCCATFPRVLRRGYRSRKDGYTCITAFYKGVGRRLNVKERLVLYAVRLFCCGLRKQDFLFRKGGFYMQYDCSMRMWQEDT